MPASTQAAASRDAPSASHDAHASWSAGSAATDVGSCDGSDTRFSTIEATQCCV